MNDLDTALRTMLRDRAQDIQTLPPAIVAALDEPAVPVPDVTMPGRQADRIGARRTGWLIAAAVAAVLAVAGVSYAVGRDSRHHGAPPATHRPSPTTVVTPSPAPTHIERRVALTWFAMAALPGFSLHERDSQPGVRILAVRMNSDQGVPVGCNGCESASDYVYVYDQGAFDASAHHVTTWQHVDVGGRTAYLGSMTWIGSQYTVPTVAWQYAPGRWAIVQGVTQDGGTQSTLLTVARAVRPSESVPILLPFRFRYLPDLPLVDVMDDRSEGYSFTMTFGDVAGRSFGIELWNGTSLVGHYVAPDPKPAVIGGLHGYTDAGAGAGVLYHGGGATLGLSEGQGTATKADLEQFSAVITGLTWANGNGSAPQIPAEQAIP